MDDRCRGLTRVYDERMAFGEPAHRDLPAVTLDLLGLYRAALLRDAEERLEKKTALRAATCEAAGLIGARQRIQDRLDSRDAARVLARHRVDAAEHPDEMKDGLGDERRGHVRREHLLGLRAGPPFELREDGALVDTGVDSLFEDARCLLLRERDHARDEIAA